jgi:hypothetical protein
MSFRKKIDMLLEAKKLERLSINKIEQALAVDGTIYKNHKADTYPTESKLVSEIIRIYNIRQEWWDKEWETGSNNIFNTSVPKSTGSKQNGELSSKETFYEDLMERNKDYFVAPRAIFTDYKIVPDKIIDVIIQSNANERKALQDAKTMEIDSLEKKYEMLIEGLENKVDRLEKEKAALATENEDLRRQIPTKAQ